MGAELQGAGRPRRWVTRIAAAVLLVVGASGCAGLQRAMEADPADVDVACSHAREQQQRALDLELPELDPRAMDLVADVVEDLEARRVTDLSGCDDDAVNAALVLADRLVELLEHRSGDAAAGLPGEAPSDGDGSTADAPGAGGSGAEGSDVDPAAARAVGGSIHALSPGHPGYRQLDEACLSYRTWVDASGVLELGPCSDQQGFNLVLDLEQGTLTAEVDLELSCPGWYRCGFEERSTGSVRGRVGPVPIGVPPPTPPAGFPLPAYHYEARQDTWTAMGPVQLTLAVSGSDQRGQERVSREETEVVTGWMHAELQPMGAITTGENPSQWQLRAWVVVEHPRERDPAWDLWVGAEVDLEEDGVPQAPRG